MNPVQVLFQQPWIARLGWTLLHFLWQGILIATLLSVVRARAASASFRYVLACAALAAMVLAPLVTYQILGGAPVATPLPVVASAAHAADGGADSSLPLANAWDWVSPRLGAAWLLGALLCSLRLLGGWFAASRLRRSTAEPVPEEWYARLDRLMARVGVRSAVRLRVSSRLEAPAVIGWLRPVILIPVGVLTGVPAAQVEALLAHELAHIRRYDYLVNLVQSVIEAVLFYHPAVWWVSRQIRAEREHCCDDLAVEATGGDVLTYARALAELESARPVHLHAMAATGGPLRNRIRRLLDPSRPHSHTLPAGGAAWALSALLVIGGGALAVRGAQAPAPAQEASVKLDELWPDTVKQGDMKVEVRGLGTLTSATTAQVKIAESQAGEIAAGQTALLDFRKGRQTVQARVVGITPVATNGLRIVDVQVASLPPETPIGDTLDAAIMIGTLSNVVYVGRPVFGQANSEAVLFKFEPDGHHAARVKVQFGRSSISTIQVKSGLQPGDRVILNDMASYANYDRIVVQ